MFAYDTFIGIGKSVITTQLLLRNHFNNAARRAVPSRNTIIRRLNTLRTTSRIVKIMMVLRPAHQGQKLRVEQKLDWSWYSLRIMKTAKAGPINRFGLKSYPTGRTSLWRPSVHRFLIFRCRLFLSLQIRIRLASDFSPANRKRKLGLDCRKTH